MDLRGRLQSELLERYRKNPRYSLRAYARSLSVEPSALSKILRGKRRISPLMQYRLGLKMKLSAHELKELASRESSEAMLFDDLPADAFEAIADWYHCAILELTRVKGFRSDSRWIARALEISVPEANVAIERLERLGMIKRDTDGSIKPTKVNNSIADTSYLTEAARRFQTQVLVKALEAMEQVEQGKRENSGMTMAIDVSKLPDVERIIRRFRRSLCKFLEGGERKDEVYQLVVALYPLSRVSEITKLKKGDSNE